MGAEEFGRTSALEMGRMHAAWRLRERRMDYRAGIVVSTMLELQRDATKRGTPFTPGDVFPSLIAWEERASRLTPEQEEARICSLMANLGARHGD